MFKRQINIQHICMCQLCLFRTSQQTPSREDFLHCQCFTIDSRKWLWSGDWLASYDLSPNFCLRPTFCPNVSERCFHWSCCGCQTFLNEVGREGYFAFSNIRTPILPPDPSLPDPAPNPNRSRKRGGLSEDEGGENAAQYLPPADSDCAFADDTWQILNNNNKLKSN